MHPLADILLRLLTDTDGYYGFEHAHVQSIVVDADKMGMLPYPSGIFLCRKNLQSIVNIDVPYISGHMDMTISGSRTFLSAACGWYYMNVIKDSGHTKMVAECIQKRNELVEKLKAVEGVTILPYSNYINILPISTPFDVSNKMHPNYNLRFDHIRYNNKDVIVYKLCIFPHTFAHIDQFVQDLKQALQPTSLCES